MLAKNVKYKTVDYIFWILLILYSNPGGIFMAFGEDTSSKGSIDSADFIAAMMFGCYILISISSKTNGNTYKKIFRHIILFALYYFIIFGFFVPILKESLSYDTFSFLKKSRKPVYSFLIFIMVYKFYLRSSILLFKTLVISSIIVLSLFFITFLTGIELLPVSTANRGFVNVERVFIASEGFMLLLIPLGVSLIVFKTNTKWRKLILLAFFMMFMNYVLSITRRDIIGTLIYFILASILYNYFRNKPLIPVKKMLTVSLYIVVFGTFISLTFPKYYEAGVTGLEESFNILKEGETSTGKEDVRMGFGKDFMQNLIIDNIWFGTGFDVRWRGGYDKEGYETSDYPFLAAIAMTGVFGILVFLPIYIIIVKAVIFDLKFLKNNVIKYESVEFCFFISFLLYVIYDLVQYMNWFKPVSLSRGFHWYAYLAMYIGAREVYYAYYLKNKNIKTISL